MEWQERDCKPLVVKFNGRLLNTGSYGKRTGDSYQVQRA